MKIPLTPAEFAHLGACLPHATPLSMLDGYLAAVASGPNFVFPEQILRCLWNAGQDTDESMGNLIIRHYLTVNDALNDQVYAPRMTSVHEWCRGYLAGFSYDMIAWAPLLAARPDGLKVIISGAEDQSLHDAHEALTTASCRIHGFWVQQRRLGVDSNGLLGQLTALSHRQADPLTPLH
jgi:yecA family protein